jgi:hypothetical protein
VRLSIDWLARRAGFSGGFADIEVAIEDEETRKVDEVINQEWC